MTGRTGYGSMALISVAQRLLPQGMIPLCCIESSATLSSWDWMDPLTGLLLGWMRMLARDLSACPARDARTFKPASALNASFRPITLSSRSDKANLAFAHDDGAGPEPGHHCLSLCCVSLGLSGITVTAEAPSHERTIMRVAPQRDKDISR